MKVDLSDTFDTFVNTIQGRVGSQYTSDLAEANTRSRFRMVTLYQIAATTGGIVVGTGNKVEDYGVGFILSMVTVALTLLRLRIFIKQKFGN